MRGSLSGTLATMGPGVPYAIGAKWAHPDRPVDRAGRRRRDADERDGRADHHRALLASSGPIRGLIVAVLHNNDLNQVTWEMRAMEGSPKFAESQTLPDVDYARSPAAWACTGINVDTARRRRPGLGRARWPPTGRPCSTSAATPTCRRSRRTPPSSRPSRWPKRCCTATRTPSGFVKQGIKQKVQQYLPGTKDASESADCAAERVAASTGLRRATSAPAGSSGPVGADGCRRGRSPPAEIYTSHDGASFGNKMMWWPIVVVPTAIPAGIAAVFSRRAAKTVLPLASRGDRRQRAAGHLPALRAASRRGRAAGTAAYNIEMGPPVFAPLLAALVGGMGLLAAVLRREDDAGRAADA